MVNHKYKQKIKIMRNKVDKNSFINNLEYLSGIYL
jgi:hypothetical protein